MILYPSSTVMSWKPSTGQNSSSSSIIFSENLLTKIFVDEITEARAHRTIDTTRILYLYNIRIQFLKSKNNFNDQQTFFATEQEVLEMNTPAT